MKQSLYSLVWILKTLQYTETNVSGARKKQSLPIHVFLGNRNTERMGGFVMTNLG